MLKNELQLCELVSNCCLTLNEQYFSYIMTITSYIQRDDDDVHLV